MTRGYARRRGLDRKLYGVVTVTVTCMPSHTVNFGREQYNYIFDTAEGNVSERVRELVDKGMEAERDE